MANDGLHVWHNDNDWVIAASAEDAQAAYLEHIGSTFPPDAEDNEWEQWRDGRSLKMFCARDGSRIVEGHEGTLVTKTCAEWAASHGRGYLGSESY